MNNLIGKYVEWENQHYKVKFQGVIIGTLQNGFIAVKIKDDSIIFICPPDDLRHKSSQCRFTNERI